MSGPGEASASRRNLALLVDVKVLGKGGSVRRSSFGNVIEITPPLTLTREEIDEGVAILDQAVREYLEGAIPDESIAEFSGWFA